MSDTREALAMNGHLMVYRVDVRDDGTEHWSQWDAQHSNNCPCDVDDRPDW